MTSPNPPTPEKEHDCYDFIDKAKNVARATWVCPECGKDISIQYVLYYEATHPDA